ncbi:MAG: cytochrome c3 family protein [Sulfurospirillaceae bacterium]|nr:cytochrome c3 family protein [Sulfurospirillaceae bacterium]MDD3463736.1 cytochrome c3 family protein [Sulfurospirillaceae bacterium]
MKRFKVTLALMAILVVAPLSLFGHGMHDGIGCLACHSTHYAVDHKIFAVKNPNAKNPLTGEILDKLVAKNCLGCHQLPEYGGSGIRPIHLHNSHPIGMIPNPKIASVPQNILREGLLDCVSCHEVHPSNPNFAYLRVDVGKQAENIQKLCATCHSAKVDLASAGIQSVEKMEIFSAMDQEKGAGYSLRNEVVTQNKTKEYVKPLGKLPPNDIMPNYTSPPAWIYSPEIDPETGAPITAAPATGTQNK